MKKEKLHDNLKHTFGSLKICAYCDGNMEYKKSEICPIKKRQEEIWQEGYSQKEISKITQGNQY